MLPPAAGVRRNRWAGASCASGVSPARPPALPCVAPAGGWGWAKWVARGLLRERVVASAPPAWLRQNKPEGFACVSCAWAKPAEPHLFEFCEEGAKATTWEITTRRVTD